MTSAALADPLPIIDDLLPRAVETRRDLHRHPELSHQESRTSRLVQDRLRELGIPFRAGLGGPERGTGTGVLGFLPATESPESAPTVALRADMDALPIEERTGRDYASRTPGVMHACGHDGHTAILLAAAEALAKLPHRPNNVRFVFQPAEEGGAGGEKMVRDGALDGAEIQGLRQPRVDRIFGLHGWPDLPLGTIGTRPGPLLAATDDFVVRVRGVGGHAAMPHRAADPIVAAAAVVTALQTIASRSASPLDSVVCTVGVVRAGVANNVIPAECELHGTVRTLLPQTREMARRRFYEIVENTARAHGCAAGIEWEEGYPVTANDPRLAQAVLRVAADELGAARAFTVPEPFMGGEDFSYYGREVPACFFLLGLLPDGHDPATTPRLHQDTFDFNDEAIRPGVRMMVRLATGEIA